MTAWSCPCGCSLALDAGQLAREMRLIAIVGTAPPQHIDLRRIEGSRPDRADPPEPTVKGICRSCGAAMHLFAYLVDALKLRGAPWPHCESCVSRRTAQERAA